MSKTGMVMKAAALIAAAGGAPVRAQTPEPPAPSAAPATEPVSMCVVGADGQLRMVNGWRDLADGGVYVSQNGLDVPFSTAYPAASPTYVKGAPWYVAARPLVVGFDSHDLGGDVDDELDDAAEKLARNRMEFVNFGATQPLPMGEVLYIGQIDGTPLYATRADIGGLLPDLEARLRVSRDLDQVLNDEAFATRFATEIRTFYTVVEPGAPTVGDAASTSRGGSCVFQPMSSTHALRRTRG